MDTGLHRSIIAYVHQVAVVWFGKGIFLIHSKICDGLGIEQVE